MLERILVPLDGSSTAEAILPHVRRILGRAESEILLVCVIPPDYASMDTPVRDASARLAEVERRLVGEGAKVRSRVRVGKAAESILDEAQKEHASLIAMTTHGRTGLPRWIFGSVTEKVLRASSVPVWVVRSFGAGAKWESGIRKILVPLDGSTFSSVVLSRVQQLARLFQSHVTLFHVIDDGEAAFAQEGAEQKLHSAAGELQAAGVSVNTILRRGNPASEILDTCRPPLYDLIAMTTHGRSGFSRWVFGSVTEKVLRGARVPLLIVRGVAATLSVP